jgi:ankyrin repeat protein
LFLTFEASESVFFEIVEILIEKGAEIEAKDEEGWTPLHYGKL